MESFCQLIGLNSDEFSKQEIFILEGIIFISIYQELTELFKSRYKTYFRLMKLNNEMENIMFETNFIRSLINDILSTEEYSLLGIANYTHLPEDAIYDVVVGMNTNPSLIFSIKIIELHRTVRPQLYQEILKKISDVTNKLY